MVNLDGQKIAKIKRGEIIQLISLCVSAAGVIFFIVTYVLARVQNSDALKIVSFAVSPALIAVGSLIAAVFNLKYGRLSEKLIRQYILDICLEHPEAMHPEKDSLTFYITEENRVFTMTANGFRDGLKFDFSAYKWLFAIHKSAIFNEIGTRLTVSFCRLFERGAKYKDVAYTVKLKSKSKKPVPIISNGIPDRKSFKIYIKNK